MVEQAMSLQAEAAFEGSKAAPRIGKVASAGEARRVAQDFEAFFLSQMMKPMFDGIEAEEPFGGGAGEDMYRALQIDEYGKAIAKNGGIGIADSIMREILKMQEVA